MAAGIAGRVKKIKKLPFILLRKSSYLSCRARRQGRLTETSVVK